VSVDRQVVSAVLQGPCVCHYRRAAWGGRGAHYGIPISRRGRHITTLAKILVDTCSTHVIIIILILILIIINDFVGIVTDGF
jgi:hypothetical protein